MAQKTPRIEIVDRQSVFLIDEESLRDLAVRALTRLGSGMSVNLVFTDDATIHELNRRYLDHDYPTDVLTFALDEVRSAEDDVNAEVVVSVETAVREAAARRIEPGAEIFLYCLHGLLHLHGFDDRRSEEAGEMNRETRRVLEELGFDEAILGDLLGDGSS